MSDQTGVDEVAHNVARRRAAEAMRRLGHALMRHEAPVEMLERAAELSDRAAAELEAAPVRARSIASAARSFLEPDTDEEGRVVHFDDCFVSGPWNPLGIGLDVFQDGDEVRATAHLGAAFEGAPGRAHGGIVAAVFDDVLGYLLTVHSIPAFTGELTIRYLAATPVERDVEFRSRIIHRDGRRILMEAEATVDGDMIATATATFITVSPKNFSA